jgi:hypothetical protein
VTLFDKVPLNGMHPVHRSDLFRYEELAERGGVYFDTDIVFFRPVPESLLQHDAVISVHPKHRFCNIGCLMATPGSPLFADIARAAKIRYREAIDRKFYDGQLIGTHLLNRFFFKHLKMEQKEIDPDAVLGMISARYGVDVANMPSKFVTPVDSFRLHKLYNAHHFDPPKGSVGVHWYAGDKFNSRPFEKRVDSENYKNWRCYLTEAIEVALDYEPSSV